MSKEDLMKPRFELIADYPGNSRPIGSISTEISTVEYFRRFKCNFREMRWWEKRELPQLPEYLKNNSATPKTFHKVRLWSLVAFDWIKQPVCYLDDNDLFHNNLWSFEPATQSDYDHFLNENK